MQNYVVLSGIMAHPVGSMPHCCGLELVEYLSRERRALIFKCYFVPLFPLLTFCRKLWAKYFIVDVLSKAVLFPHVVVVSPAIKVLLHAPPPCCPCWACCFCACSVSPNRKKKSEAINSDLDNPALVGPGPANNMFGGGRAYKDMFDEAMQGGRVEVRVRSFALQVFALSLGVLR